MNKKQTWVAALAVIAALAAVGSANAQVRSSVGPPPDVTFSTGISCPSGTVLTSVVAGFICANSISNAANAQSAAVASQAQALNHGRRQPTYKSVGAA